MELITLNEDSEEKTSTCIQLFSHQQKILYYVNKKESIFLENFNKAINGYNDNNNNDSLLLFRPLFKACLDFLNPDEDKNEAILKLTHILPKTYNIKLPTGAGKSFLCLSIINEIPTFLHCNLSVIIVSFKLMEQWEQYLCRAKLINKAYIIRTRKDIKKIYWKNKNILLISNTMCQYFNFSIYVFLRMFIDEYSLLKKEISKLKIKCLFSYHLCATEPVSSQNTILVSQLDPRISSLPPINEVKILLANTLQELTQNIYLSEETKNDIELDNFTNLNRFLQTIFNDCITRKRILLNQLKETNLISQRDILKTQISEIEENIQNLKDRLFNEKCLICLEKSDNRIILCCCKIAICSSCFSHIEICIYCKKNIKNISTIGNENFNEIFQQKINKICTLPFTLQSRIIIVGNNRSVINSNLSRISQKLFNKTSYKYYQGNAVTCNKIISDFQNNTFQILCFPNLSMVCGLNLEYVTDLIVLDKIDKDIREQLIGRLQRFGRFNPLNIYDIIYE